MYFRKDNLLPSPPQTVKVWRLWTSKEVANFYSKQPATINNWRKQGKIPAIQLNTGTYRYNMGEVQKALEEGSGAGNIRDVKFKHKDEETTHNIAWDHHEDASTSTCKWAVGRIPQ